MGTNIDSKIVIGQRQILRELKNDNVAKITIALDADESYVNAIISSASVCSVAIERKFTMQEIADTYGIDVACGAVALLKN